MYLDPPSSRSMYFFIVLSGLHFELTTLWQVTPNQRKLRDRTRRVTATATSRPVVNVAPNMNINPRLNARPR